jgi:hypothetical protein
MATVEMKLKVKQSFKARVLISACKCAIFLLGKASKLKIINNDSALNRAIIIKDFALAYAVNNIKILKE